MPFGNSGRFPLARRIESRTVARPKEGDRCRFTGTLSGIGGRERTGTGGICDGGGGIWDGRRPDCARNESAVIHNPCRSCDTVVNFNARAGVSMRMERLKADRSSAPLGNGVSSWTSTTDWMTTVTDQHVFDRRVRNRLTLPTLLAKQSVSSSWLLTVPHNRTLVR